MLNNIAAGRLSNSKSVITIEELDQSCKYDGEDTREMQKIESKSNLPEINTRSSIGVAAVSAVKTGQEIYLKSNTQHWKNKISNLSSRSSSGVALSPLTTSIVEDTKEDPRKALATAKP